MKRKPKPEPLAWDLPVTVRSHGEALYVTIGKRSIWLKGARKGNAFRVSAWQVRHWNGRDGAGKGPMVTKKERSLLIVMLETKSRQSPWMRIIFY